MNENRTEAESLNSPVSVRFLDISHADRLAEIEKACFPIPWSRELIASEFLKPVFFGLGLFHEADLIGYCLSHLVVDELHILTFAIDDGKRRQGFGGLLLEQTLSMAASKGARVATLEVRLHNSPAIRLYSRFGFQSAGIRKEYYSDNLDDAIILIRNL